MTVLSDLINCTNFSETLTGTVQKLFLLASAAGQSTVTVGLSVAAVHGLLSYC